MTQLAHAYGVRDVHDTRSAGGRSHRAVGGGGGFRRNVLAELRRTLSIRGWLYQLIFAVGLPALATLAVLSSIGKPGGISVSTPEGVRTVLSGGYVAALFAAVLGVVSVTTEFRHRTIGATLLSAGRPHRWLLAKIAIVGVLGVLFTTFGQAAVLAIGVSGLRGEGLQPDPWSGELRQLTIGTASLGLFCALWGVAWGLLLRNQVLAVTGMILYSTVVESVLLRYFPDQGKYLPGGLQAGIVADPNWAHVSTGAAYGLYAGWIVLALAAGWWRLTRRDVPA